MERIPQASATNRRPTSVREEITDRLAAWGLQIEVAPESNAELERVSAAILNALFGWDLKRLELKRVNFPAVDLGDDPRRIAIQVTVQKGTTKKAAFTLDMLKEAGLEESFDHFFLFTITGRKAVKPRPSTIANTELIITKWTLHDFERILSEHELADNLKAITPTTHHCNDCSKLDGILTTIEKFLPQTRHDSAMPPKHEVADLVKQMFADITNERNTMEEQRMAENRDRRLFAKLLKNSESSRRKAEAEATAGRLKIAQLEQYIASRQTEEATLRSELATLRSREQQRIADERTAL